LHGTLIISVGLSDAKELPVDPSLKLLSWRVDEAAQHLSAP
jgi:hypothetical protein